MLFKDEIRKFLKGEIFMKFFSALIVFFMMTSTAFASLNCDSRDDFIWGEAKVFTLSTIKYASVDELDLIFEAFNRYTDSVYTITEVFDIADDNEIMLYDAFYPATGQHYTAVSFYAGDNSFEYLFDSNGDIATYIIDYCCE